MRQRDRYVDVAKGIAMLLIVSIHTEGFGVFGYPLAFVAVPIFFFMSGFYDRSERDFMVWLPKALRTLILPAVVWIVVATLYAQLLGYAKDMSWGDLPFDWYNIAGSNGPAWFLFALLYAKMMVWAMLKVKLPKTILGGVIFAIGYLGMKVNMPLLIDEGCAALPFYVAGKYGYPHMKKLLTSKPLWVAGVVALLAYHRGYCSFTIVPQANGLYTPLYLVALSVMVLTFLPILYVAGKLQGWRWLDCIGKHSLGIMLLHAPMCHTAAVVLNRVLVMGSLPWTICFLLAYVAIVAFAYGMTVVIERYCPVLFGK